MRLLILATLGLLVACSASAPSEGGSAGEPSAESTETVAPSAVVGSEDADRFDAGESDEAALERQYSYLEDEVLTDEEYEAAFRVFMDCANEHGAAVEVRNVDPDSGQIFYNTWVEDKMVVDECYRVHFEEVDFWFQTTNPVVLQQMADNDRREWRDYVVPCLERFDVAVPEHLDGTEVTFENDAAMPFMHMYYEHLDAGSCE